MSQKDEDEFEDDAVEAAREEFEKAVATRGLKVAFDACVDVAADKNATPQARANAASSLIRAAGMFNFKEGEERRRKKQPYERTPEELSASIRRGERRLRQIQLELEALDNATDDSVFD